MRLSLFDLPYFSIIWLCAGWKISLLPSWLQPNNPIVNSSDRYSRRSSRWPKPVHINFNPIRHSLLVYSLCQWLLCLQSTHTKASSPPWSLYQPLSGLAKSCNSYWLWGLSNWLTKQSFPPLPHAIVFIDLGRQFVKNRSTLNCKILF